MGCKETKMFKVVESNANTIISEVSYMCTSPDNRIRNEEIVINDNILYETYEDKAIEVSTKRNDIRKVSREDNVKRSKWISGEAVKKIKGNADAKKKKTNIVMDSAALIKGIKRQLQYSTCN